MPPLEPRPVRRDLLDRDLHVSPPGREGTGSRSALLQVRVCLWYATETLIFG
jgi:hypothetical protein